MFDLMRSEIELEIKPELALIKKGDAVIWHPGLMHGGSPATKPGATRYSSVFHFAPTGVNVRSKAFPNDFMNLPTYGLKTNGGNPYCRVSLPAVMI
jgi:ectoine hydroxylase-related dioxygenase (phytanoyl-CoA dioxygenase family)